MATIRGHTRFKDKVVSDSFADDILNKLDTFKQNKIHQIEDSVPSDKVGENGEVRVFKDGASDIRLLVKLNGTWKKTAVLT